MKNIVLEVASKMDLKKVQRGAPQVSHSKYVESIIKLMASCKAKGDIVELGVARGRNSVIIGNIIRGTKRKSKYYGLDTFSGYPSEDIDNSALQAIQDRGSWNINIDEVKKTLKNAGLSKICELIPGDLKVTLSKLCEERKLKIAMLYVDCNAYNPSIAGMRLAYPYMTKGSVICIDEHRVGGETKAIIEFCKEKNLKLVKTGDRIGIPMYAVKVDNDL